jgi:signal transduction histidine kinase
LYQAEREQRELAETLIEASQILVSTLNVNVVLDRILEQVSRIVKNDVSNIMLIEGDRSDVVRSRGYEYFDAGTFIDTFVFPLSGMSIRRQIIETGEPIVVPDVRMDPRWTTPTDAAWLRSYIAAPISIQNKVIGFINVGISMPGFYGPVHAKWLLAFAHQAAIAFQNARLFEETRKAAGHLEVLSRRLLGIQETERSYIARELHDEVGQTLTAAIYSLQAIQRLQEASPFQAKLDECMAIVDLTLQQVRNMSLDLHPSILDDLGLVPALRWFVDRETQWGGFSAQVVADAMDERLLAEIELVCFRVVQEALTNVTRHARAKHVTVDLWKRGSELHLVVRDDGVGFNVH